MYNLSQCQWWREPDLFELEDGTPLDGCSAARMWRVACNSLVAPHHESAWNTIVEAAPPPTVWHSLTNCTAYQAGVWASLLRKGEGMCDVTHPAAFRLAIVLRHIPTELVVKLLADLLATHPQSQDLIEYVVSLLTDDTPVECGGAGAGAGGASGGAEAAPERDRLLFGDCELAVVAAKREEYDAHAKLVQAEYTKLTHHNYVNLRIKILEQLLKVPTIYQTPEFQHFEQPARDNIAREIKTLKEQLATMKKE